MAFPVCVSKTKERIYDSKLYSYTHPYPCRPRARVCCDGRPSWCGVRVHSRRTDIHRGPAEVAAAHLAANGIGEDRAAVLLTDGLHGAESYHPTDICVFGMGGEMIAHIIEEAPWLKDPSVRLILQPMTKQDVLRQYLDQNGFRVIAERLVKTDRIYQLLCAEYDGAVRSHTPLELMIGKENLDRRDELTLELARRHVDVLTATREGKRRATNPDTTCEDALLSALNHYLEPSTEV